MSSLAFPDFCQTVRHAMPWVGAFFMSFAAAQGAIQVPTVPVQAKSVGTGFELDGVIQPVKQSTISAQASGRVATLMVKAGDDDIFTSFKLSSEPACGGASPGY